MSSSQFLRSSDHNTTNAAVPTVGEPISVGYEGEKLGAEKVSEFGMFTPSLREEKVTKRRRDDLNANTELNKQPAKKRKCRPKVADDKFSLKPKKVKVKIAKPVKVKNASSKKVSQVKKKYVRKKKEQPNVAVTPPNDVNDAVGREDVVSEETLLDSAKVEESKQSCRRPLEFKDEIFTGISAFGLQGFKGSPEPMSSVYGKSDDNAVEPPSPEEVKLNSGRAEVVNISSVRLVLLAEQKDSGEPSRETIDYQEVNSSTTTVTMSEPDTEMDQKILELTRLEIASSKKDKPTPIVYVRKKKVQPVVNIQHNVSGYEPPSDEEVKDNKSEIRAQTLFSETMLDTAGQENNSDSRLKLKVVTAKTNKNKICVVSSSNSKNEDRLETLHVPLVANGRNMRTCQCVQLLRKDKLSCHKIKKQQRILRKNRVDVSVLLLPPQTLKQVQSKESTLQYQEMSIPTRKRSKCTFRRRDFSSLLMIPQLKELATISIGQKCSMQSPKTDIWPAEDHLVTMPKYASPSLEEKLCVTNKELDLNEDPQFEEFGLLFTINKHLFGSNMTDDSGNASQNNIPIQCDPTALDRGLDYSNMNKVSCQQLYSNLHSFGPWTNGEVPVHTNVYSADSIPSQNSLFLQTDYSDSISADAHTISEPPIPDTTNSNNQLLNHVWYSATNDQRFIYEAESGLWTVDGTHHQNVIYNHQLLAPHFNLASIPKTDNYATNSNVLVPYSGPSTVIHGHELVARVDDIGNRALVTSKKKKKVICHVDFDSKTIPMWKALMGVGDFYDHKCNEDEESKKWWQKERRVFEKKVHSFITSMHDIQGNRRFSRWKGSVLDSVMGVFLTQNVSDHLSSSAYMSLAARFPVRPIHTQKAAEQDYEVNGASQESFVSNDIVVVPASELSDQESLTEKKGQPLHNNARTESAESNLAEVGTVMPTVGLSGFEEWLSLQDQMNPKTKDPSHLKSDMECLSHKEQDALPRNPSYPNSKIEEFFGQQEKVTPPDSSPNPITESCEFISHQQNQTTHPPNSLHPESETDGLQGQSRQPQDSTHPNSETEMKKPRPKVKKNTTPTIDWLQIKRKYCNEKRERNEGHTDSIDWDAVRKAPVEEVSQAIKKRGQHRILAESMQGALNRIYTELGSLDLEWLRDTPPDVTKDFLLSINGLGLKSVECIRLLALEQVAFPVDTNVGRIAVRLGWVDLKDVPEGLQFHLLQDYPMLDTIQKYLWPRLCELDQLTLYELHYQMITFGKVFCKKRNPYCNACPLRGSCKYFASAYASSHLQIANGASSQSLPLLGNNGSQSQTTNSEPIVEMPASPEPCIDISTSVEASDKITTFSQMCTEMPTSPQVYIDKPISPHPYSELPTSQESFTDIPSSSQPYTEMPSSPRSSEMCTSPRQYYELPTSPQSCTKMPTCLPCIDLPTSEVLEPHESSKKVSESMSPIVEMPRSPEYEHGDDIVDMEDLYMDVPEIPTIVLNDEDFISNVTKYIDEIKFKADGEISNFLVVSAYNARIPAPKLKNIKDLRTEHLVYEIPDSHPLLRLHGLGKRDSEDPCFYLLAIWSPAESSTLTSQNVNGNSNCQVNNEDKCSDNYDSNQQDVDYVLGTFMIPCRTSMLGRFPLNGTYFQVNEVFADDETSQCPVDIPRSFLWNLKRCIVYCGSSTSSITSGLTIKEIQMCFWRDYICVRGINRKTKQPKDLVERLHRLKTSSASQAKRTSDTDKRKTKKNKNGDQMGDFSFQ